MKILETGIIYDNPIPQLRSKQGVFPYLCRCADGKLAAVFVIGEAFESADQASYISFSEDEGKSWSDPMRMYGKPSPDNNYSEFSKAIKLSDGTLISIGYGFLRNNPDLPLGNPETGGLLDDFVFTSTSKDNGKTWSDLQKIECSWGPHIEASAPILEMKDGTLVTPITGFPAWDGKMTGPQCGRVLRSEDGGKTWNDDVVCMQFEENVTCYEQRMCQTDSGILVDIGWNENVDTGERMPNHFTYSEDGGKTWTEPHSTGVMGQASFVCSLGGEKILAIHALRRDTDRPGIYGYVVDFSEKTWKIEEEMLLWEPSVPIVKDTKMAEIFSFLKFGQPSAIKLDDSTFMMTHWYCDCGQYKILYTKIKIN